MEQGHKDGLAAFVDVAEPTPEGASGAAVDSDAVERGAYAAIAAMESWWDALLGQVERRSLTPTG